MNSHFLDPPMVSLQLGSSLNPEDIEEGDDCYFECKIEANPRTYKVVWRHNVSTHLILERETLQTYRISMSH